MFERLRSGRLLRVVSMIIALAAFQNSFACMCDDPPRAPDSGIAAMQSPVALDAGIASEIADDGCGALCWSCTSCGCCSAAAGPRVTADSLDSCAAADPKITLATSAVVIWTPPTLLRPPIRSV
jgi:hypothetical protein